MQQSRIRSVLHKLCKLLRAQVSKHGHDVLLGEHIDFFALGQHLRGLLDLLGDLGAGLRLESTQHEVLCRVDEFRVSLLLYL